MYRGKKVSFRSSKQDLERLFQCNRLSAEIWNTCLEESKQFFLTERKWINKSQLQTLLKGKVALHSQSIQAVVHKYLFSRDSTHKSIQKGIKTARYPYHEKKFFNTKWVDKAFTIHPNGKISLSMGVQGGKRIAPIIVYAKNLPDGDIKEIELCFDRKLYLSISYDDGQVAENSAGTQSAGVDMGEIHSFAVVTENGQSLIVSGRKMRSIHRFRNTKIKELQKLMSRCTKHSRQWKRYNRAKQYILLKSERQLQDAAHKITHSFIDWCAEQRVHTLHVGDCRQVSRKSKKKANRFNRQKLSNWNVGQLVGYATYKAESRGVKLKLRNEAYTTQTCPVCKRRKKPKGRQYQCVCGYKQHRDVHSGANILTDALVGSFQPVQMQGQTKYLRPA